MLSEAKNLQLAASPEAAPSYAKGGVVPESSGNLID
jgi:hypothetical protein